jgi:hypothetical protein
MQLGRIVLLRQEADKMAKRYVKILGTTAFIINLGVFVLTLFWVGPKLGAFALPIMFGFILFVTPRLSKQFPTAHSLQVHFEQKSDALLEDIKRFIRATDASSHSSAMSGRGVIHFGDDVFTLLFGNHSKHPRLIGYIDYEEAGFRHGFLNDMSFKAWLEQTRASYAELPRSTELPPPVIQSE